MLCSETDNTFDMKYQKCRAIMGTGDERHRGEPQPGDAGSTLELNEAALDTGERVTGEFTSRGSRGDRHYRAAGEPLSGRDGSVEGVLFVAIDVTEEHELREQRRTLLRQNERLEEFASVIAHDLRTPLNVAQGRIEFARDEHHSEDLDTADAWEMAHPDGAALTLETAATISADRGRLEQPLENLFGNALAHGRADAHVRVGQLSDDFYVEDDGPGIPEETREHVFDAGFSTSAAGTGFGLSIVESIAHGHGRDVAVTDGTDGGARFDFTNVSVLE